MTDARRRTERIVTALLLACSLLLAAAATDNAWRRVGRTEPGFAVMENLLVVVGGGQRDAALRPFDRVVALDGHPLRSARDITAEAERQPPKTPLHYTVARGHEIL